MDRDRSPSPPGRASGSHRRLPPWLKVPAAGAPRYLELKALVDEQGVGTVCQEARCPNIGECWGQHGTATLMILGQTCTRSCDFCAVKAGRPSSLDPGEPLRVAQTIAALGLRHAVVTSVSRDDLADGGAAAFAETVRLIRELSPDTTTEVLIPDFGGDRSALGVVLDARPDILAHNVETVPRLYHLARPQADYRRSLDVLEWAKDGGAKTKSGLMVGLGEAIPDVVAVMGDLAGIGLDVLTIGQYLQPTPRHLPVVEFHPPAMFERLRRAGEELGIPTVVSGPLVRSSYHAAEHAGRVLE
jgi:lipoyl synthase